MYFISRYLKVKYFQCISRAVTFASDAGDRSSISGHDRPKSSKQVVIALLQTFGNDMSVTWSRSWRFWTDADVGVHSRCDTVENNHCSMAMSAEYRSNLQPFTDNGDVSIWVKNSTVGRKAEKKTKKNWGDCCGINMSTKCSCKYGNWHLKGLQDTWRIWAKA